MDRPQILTELMPVRIISYKLTEGGMRLVVEAPNEDLADTFASLFTHNVRYSTIGNGKAETYFEWDDVEVYSDTTWGYLILPDPNIQPKVSHFLESDLRWLEELTSSFINLGDSWSATQMKLAQHAINYRDHIIFEMEQRWQEVEDEKYPKGKIARLAAEEARKERLEIANQERLAKMTPKAREAEKEAENDLPF
ncbi:hypothetical protein [Hymenobacter armeniacus]|uniref:Uncharacterized protein n=1 Tax=Hymenobacter armeniacus TaxID=2771358 RepID=A0ABR8JQD7_9BACT|nr:hypothetical protein [Hymenobacter armeniacus]MBD2720805.1 hypothetical protein [Hymenobacter armeniacus]